MQVAQLLGVGRRDVDGHEIHHRAAAFQHLDVIAGPIRTVLVGAEVQAHRDARLTVSLGQTREGRVHPVVVEAEAVDDRAIFGQAEHARFRISGLGARRDRADLDEPEPGLRQGIDHLGVLVVARREPHGVGKVQPRDVAGDAGRGEGAGQGHHPRFHRRQRQPMRALGVDPVQGEQPDPFDEVHRTSAGSSWPVSPSG